MELVEKLAFVEYQLGEDYSILGQVKMLQYMSKEISKAYGIDLDIIIRSRKNVFDLIIMDEQQHHRTLIEINELLAKKGLVKNNDLKFKYQTPDAWTFPPPNVRT